MSLTKVTYSMIDGAVVNVFDYGAAGDGTTNDTSAINAAIAAAPTGGTVYFPPGNYAIDPITITKSIRLTGNANRQTAFSNARIQARGNQTHLIMFKGGAGTFPTDFLNGIGLDYITLYGNNNTISDAALVVWNGGMCNSIGLNITNCIGSAIRFKNAQDFHFVQTHIADVGDNTNQKPMVYADPTGNNNVNNIYFVDPHFESIGWSLMDGWSGDDDIFSLLGGKIEMREQYAGQSITDFAFPLFNVAGGNRVMCNCMTFTNIHYFSEPTFKFAGGLSHAVTGNKIFCVAAQTENFVYLTGDVYGVTARDNSGYNVGKSTNYSTKAASCYVEDPYWSNNNSNSTNRAIIDAVSPDLSRIVSTAGGNYTYNYAGSLTGKTFVLNGISDPIPGVKLPIGYPGTVTVYWRVKSDLAGKTLTLGYKDTALNVTAVSTGVSAPTAFGNVSMVLNSTAMASAFQATIINEQNDNNLYIDGVWLVYS